MRIPDLAGAVEKRDAAYKVKFVVPMALAERALTWARQHLEPDPHVGVNGNDWYHVNSLYFDTPALDVYQRNGSYGKAKYRVRRYGTERSVFLERKLKSRGLVSKRRTRVPEQDIGFLANGNAEPDWIGYWFRRRLAARQLMPQCQIRYLRVARIGSTQEGTLRLTVDREIASFCTGDYQVSDTGEWKALLPEQCIVELKFRLGLPPLFKALTEELALIPQPVSKYRLSVQAFGLASEPAVNGAVRADGNAPAAELAPNAQPHSSPTIAPAQPA